MRGDPDELIDTKEASKIIGCSEQSLKMRRHRGYVGEAGPPWQYVMGRWVRYRRGDVVDYIRARRTERAPPRIPAPPPRA